VIRRIEQIPARGFYQEESMEENNEEKEVVIEGEEAQEAAPVEAASEAAVNEVAVSEAAASASATSAAPSGQPERRRQEKVGLVTSDKMEKTVVVRVERQVRHPKYKRYIRRRKKFMAHDELGAHIGDIVRIIETRPLSARKRWRVVEIVQKAS